MEGSETLPFNHKLNMILALFIGFLIGISYFLYLFFLVKKLKTTDLILKNFFGGLIFTVGSIAFFWFVFHLSPLWLLVGFFLGKLLIIAGVIYKK